MDETQKSATLKRVLLPSSNIFANVRVSQSSLFGFFISSAGTISLPAYVHTFLVPIVRVCFLPYLIEINIFPHSH